MNDLVDIRYSTTVILRNCKKFRHDRRVLNPPCRFVISKLITNSAEVDSTDVPDEIESITRGLAGEQSPTNPIVVLKAARWWYLHGKGGTDPAFQWAIEWARHLATDTPSDVELFDELLEYLVAVGFADERHELR